MKHPSEQDLALHAGRDLGMLSAWRVGRHVARCEQCRQAVGGTRMLLSGGLFKERTCARGVHGHAETRKTETTEQILGLGVALLREAFELGRGAAEILQSNRGFRAFKRVDGLFADGLDAGRQRGTSGDESEQQERRRPTTPFHTWSRR